MFVGIEVLLRNHFDGDCLVGFLVPSFDDFSESTPG